jgi:hypothetical protein
MGGKRVKKQSLMNRKPFNYIAIKIALYLAIFIAQANAQVLPKEAHLERTCKKRNLDFKLENHGWLYYSYSVRL